MLDSCTVSKTALGSLLAFLILLVFPSLLLAHNPPKCKPCCEEEESNTSSCKSVPAHYGATLGGKSGNIYTERGEFYQRITDLAIPGRPGAEGMLRYAFRRHYRSRLDTNGPLGHNWNHNYFERLDVQSDGVTHHNGLDRQDFYAKNHSGDFVAPPEFYTTLLQQPDGTFELRYRGGTIKTFDTDGTLLAIHDRNGNFMTLDYNAQRQLIRVNDTLGRGIVYRYIPNGINAGRLQEIEDFIGRRVTFLYDDNGDLVKVISPAVIGTPTANDFPNGKTTRYTYSAGFHDERLNHNLLSITRPNEMAVDGPPVLINEYGIDPSSFDFDRVIRQIYGGTNASGVPAGGTFTFEYTPRPGQGPDEPVGRTRLTDRNSNVKEYEFNPLGYPLVIREFTRGLRPTDPPFYGTRMSYNADGQLLQKILPEGNSIEYTYDEANPDRHQQGNLLMEKRTADPARGGDQKDLITTYTYEPRFNEVKTVTDPRGNTRTFNFDYEAGTAQCGRIVRKQEPTVTLPDGSLQTIITTHKYNEFCQLTSETKPEGNVDEFSYFPNGGYLKEKIIDTNGARISNQFSYDPVGNIIRTIDGRGNDTLFSVNQLNQVVRTQSPATFRSTKDTFYDSNDNVIALAIENRVASVGDDGKPIFTGDGNFNVQLGNPAFLVHQYVYDILDKMVQKNEDATGSTPSRLLTDYRYDANENRTQEIFPRDNIFASVYDERDLLFTTTRGFGSPEASTFTYTYDKNRDLTLIVFGRRNPLTSRFDGFDREIGSIDAVGNQLSRNYDPNSNLIRESRFGRCGGSGPTNVLLSQREYKYDELNRRFQHDDLLFAPCPTVRIPVLTEGPLTPGDGKVSMRFIYDRNSRKVKEIQDDLDTTITEYDGVDRVVKNTDPEGNMKSFAYDGNNNVIQIVATEISQKAGVAAEAFTTINQYDTLNRPTSTTDNCGNTRRSTYDSRNNLTHSTDAKADSTPGCPGSVNLQGNSMRYIYDGMNRRLQVIQDLREDGVGSGALADQITTTSTWDGNSRVTSITDDNGNVTRFAYDALNRLTVETFADGTTKTYTYDPDDNVVSHKDNTGNIQNCLYDAINRRVRCDIRRAPGVIGTTLNTYEYDGLSRMTKMTDNNEPGDANDDSTVTVGYDSLNRMIEEVQNGKAITGDWFGNERRVTLTYPNDRKIALAFDRLDRIKSIRDARAATNIVNYDYIGPGRVLERASQNGTRLTYLNDAGTSDIGYDGVKRMITHRHLRSNNSLVVGFTHVYDREHNKLDEEKLHDAPNSEGYAYDSLYRITDFQRGEPARKTQKWVLDGVGNWRENIVDGVPEHRTVNEMNEYVTIDSRTLFHDDNGNLIDDGHTFIFQWDYRNRLRRVTRKADGVLIAVYHYDAFNRRIRKVVTNSSSLRRHPRHRRLNGTTNFFYDGWRVLEERDRTDVVTQQYVYGIYIDEPLVLDRNLDGGISAIGPNNQRLFYYQNTLYSVFALANMNGAIVELYQYDAYGTPSSSSAIGNPYMFTGQRLDPETGLMYYKNRYYSPDLGRFLSRDWRNQININEYSYVDNNPLNRVDPAGLLKCEPKFVAVSGGPESWASERKQSGCIICFWAAHYEWQFEIEFRHSDSSAGAKAVAKGEVAYAFSGEYHTRNATSDAEGKVTCDCDLYTEKCRASAQGGKQNSNDNEYSSAVVVVGEASADSAKLAVNAAVAILGQITIQEINPEIPIKGGGKASAKIVLPQTAKGSNEIERQYSFKCVEK